MNPTLIAVLAAACVGAAAGTFITYEVENERVLSIQETDAKDKVAAVQAAKDEGDRRASAIQGIANDAQGKLFAALADARSADAANDGLRKQLSGYVASVAMSVDSGAPGSGAAAVNAVRLLSDLFGRADEAAGKLAADLDVSRIAGSACEQAYDALTPTDSDSPTNQSVSTDTK